MLFLNETQFIPQAMFTVRSIGDRFVIKLLCPSVHERQAIILSEQLAAVVLRSKGRLVLELSEMKSCTCAWINALLALSKRCRDEGGQLLLVSVPEAFRAVLASTGLTKHLAIISHPLETREILGLPNVERWKLALARLLDLPGVDTPYAKAA